MTKRIRMWLRAFFLRGRTEAEMKEEMLFHLEQQTRAYIKQGLSRDEARRAATLAFGGVARIEELQRDGRGTRGLEDLLGDVRYSIRSLWRDRALTLAGVATLALGIGATTAVFSAVNAVMLRKLPFRDSERLVSVWEENSDRGWHKTEAAPANYLDWRHRMTSFGGELAAYTDYPSTVTLLGRGEPTLVYTSEVTDNFLSVLGATPRIGAGFGPDVHWAGNGHPALISSRLWRSHFGADPGVIGTTVSLGGNTRWQIIGVMPDNFAFPAPNVDIWKPFLWQRAFEQQVFFRRAHWVRVVGRLQPGATIESANAELQKLTRQLETEYPATNVRMYGGVTPIRDWIVGDTKKPLVVLLSAAAVLLLIACANVGNLLLVHAVGRSRDVSLRFALGASRARVARQTITESLVLSAIGGLAGFGLGWAGARGLMTLQPAGMLPVAEIGVDYLVLGFAIVLTTLSGLAFGLAPALIATRQSPADALASSGRTVTGGRVRRWGRQLVVAEVALAVLLTVGAGLLLRSYERLSQVAPGFDPSGVLAVSLNIPAARYDSGSKVIGFYSTVMERIGALPGVERVAAVRELSVSGPSWSSGLGIKGLPPMTHDANILQREIHGDYFRTMRVPVLKGRVFGPEDGPESEPVIVINEAMAKQYFPNDDPIGKQISGDRVADSTTLWRRIVGVVGSEHQAASLATPAKPEAFRPFVQDWTRRMSLVIRVAPGRDPLSVAGPTRRIVRELDSLLAVTAIQPMTEVHAAAMARERFIGTLVLVFAVTGIVLALVGVFGVLAQLVQARWRELGIRLALGAQRSDVRRMVVMNGMRLMAIGVVAGLLVALGATQLLASLLYEVSATDAVTYVVVALLVTAVGLLAAWIPAWRASSANPAVTLRAE
jgi:putative ABC transport system permease protein